MPCSYDGLPILVINLIVTNREYFWDKFMVRLYSIEAAHHGIASLALITLILLLSRGAAAQTSNVSASRAGDHTDNELRQGIVVESLERGWGADRAGIREGDVLLRWQRGNDHGDLTSPFDVVWLDEEQRPLGPVTIYGTRKDTNQIWTLALGKWAFKTKPNFSGLLLEQATKLQSSKDIDQDAAIENWLRTLHEHTVPGMPVALRAWFLYRAGNLQADARRWQQSDNWYREAVDLPGLEAPTRIHILNIWSTACSKRSDFSCAEEHLQQALSISRAAAETSLTTSDLLTNLGSLEHSRTDLAKAQDYYQRALIMKEKLAPKSLGSALLLYDLGLCAQVRTELDRAEGYFKQSLEMAQAVAPGSPDLTPILNGLGFLYYRKGDLSKAETYYRQTLGIEETLNSESLNIAWIYNSLGLVQNEYGNIDKAEEYFMRAFTIRKKLAPESTALIASYTCLSIVAFARGDLVSAEQYQRQALRIREKTAPGSIGLAESLINLGSIVLKRGDFTEAERYFRQALLLEEKLSPGSFNHANSFSGLAAVYEHQGELDTAEQYGRKALNIMMKIAPNTVSSADFLQNLADILDKRGDTEGAEGYVRQALAIKLKLYPSSSDTAWSLMAMGRLKQKRGAWDDARADYQQALAIYEKDGRLTEDLADSLAALGDVSLHRGEKSDAEQFYKRALDALDYQAFRIGGREVVQAGFRAKHEKVYAAYIDLLLEQNQPEAALSILEKFRARTLIGSIAEAHLEIRKNADPALLQKQVSLQANIQAKSNRRIRLVADQQPQDQIKEVEKEISELTAQYQDGEAAMRAASPAYADLTKPSPLGLTEIQQQLLDTNTVLLEYSLGEQQSHVFAISSHSLSAIKLPGRATIDSEARRVYALLTARNQIVEGETASQRDQRWSMAERDFDRAAAKLSRTVLLPVAQILGEQLKNKRLVIVADGALHYVPFAALPDPISLQTDPGVEPVASSPVKRAKLRETSLVVNHEIVYLASASLLTSLRQQALSRKPAPKTVAVMADPVFDKDDQRVIRRPIPITGNATATGHVPLQTQNAAPARPQSDAPSSEQLMTRSFIDLGLTRDGQFQLTRLNFTRREADAILAVVPSGTGLEALDFDASRATALSPDLTQYRIVHFATHGLINSEHPELSGLVLSLVDKDGHPEDGFLQLQDIYNMRLSADLVVLSACETALGKEIRGEGLIGLTRGFMYAGASRVVASLWKVSDAATAELMSSFYQSMERDHLAPAAALRAAQLNLSKQQRWKSPYYWAAFQIQGDWK
jgi:CHAT domain-containing protein/Flp pilus assembly protein TadD